MKYLAAFAALFSLSVLGASAMPYLTVLGATPNLVLILAACWASLRGQGEAMVVVPMAGVLLDLTSSDPLGTSVLALAPIVPLAAAREFRLMESDFVPALGVVAAATGAYHAISMGVLAATGQNIPSTGAVASVVLPAAIVNSLFAIIVYLPVRWLSGDLRLAGSRLGPVMPS